MRLIKFSDVVGNVTTKNIIMKSLSNNGLKNVCLFTGNSGVGKSTCAEIAALRLTCTNPIGSEPCGSCDNCQRGIKAIREDGRSPFLRKVNLALVKDKEDISKMIKEIFKVDVGDNNIVFILEEPHTLSAVHQTALLEEIDRIPNNVYVFLSTTKVNQVLPELKNRAIRFKFNSLTPKESLLLIDKISERLNLKLSSRMKEVIKTSSRGVPREIENTLDFIYKNNGVINEEEFKQFLQEVDYDQMRLLLKSYSNIQDAMSLLSSLVDSCSINEFLYFFKEYLINMAFLSKDISYRETTLSAEDKRFSKILGFNTIMSIYSEISKLPSSVSESDLQFSLLKSYSIIKKNLSKNENVSGVIGDTATSYQKNLESKTTRRAELASSNNFGSSKLSTKSFGDIIDENLH